MVKQVKTKTTLKVRSSFFFAFVSAAWPISFARAIYVHTDFVTTFGLSSSKIRHSRWSPMTWLAHHVLKSLHAKMETP